MNFFMHGDLRRGLQSGFGLAGKTGKKGKGKKTGIFEDEVTLMRQEY